MADAELPNMPTLPVIVAEACLQVLDKSNAGLSTEEYRFRREDLYNMLRDVARMSAQFAWQDGRDSAFSEDDTNPYLGSYWAKEEGEEG